MMNSKVQYAQVFHYHLKFIVNVKFSELRVIGGTFIIAFVTKNARVIEKTYLLSLSHPKKLIS